MSDMINPNLEKVHSPCPPCEEKAKQEVNLHAIDKALDIFQVEGGSIALEIWETCKDFGEMYEKATKDGASYDDMLANVIEYVAQRNNGTRLTPGQADDLYNKVFVIKAKKKHTRSKAIEHTLMSLSSTV